MSPAINDITELCLAVYFFYFNATTVIYLLFINLYLLVYLIMQGLYRALSSLVLFRLGWP